MRPASVGRGALGDALRQAGLAPVSTPERPVTRGEQLDWLTRRLRQLRLAHLCRGGDAVDRETRVVTAIRADIERLALREEPHTGLARAGSRDALGRAVHEQHACGARKHGESPPPPWERISEQARECYRRQGEAAVAVARAAGVLP